jgi:molybdenum cofactor cytidylyltransferase
MHNVTGILLAAGGGRRFGSNKLLAPLAGGVAVGIQSVRHLSAVLEEVVVVVRPGDAELMRRFADEPVRVVVCERAAEGMGASLACGIAAARHASAWLVALADMPCIDPSTIQQLSERLQEGRELVAPLHAGRRGHPVGFGARFSAELLALGGDVGARALLDQYANHLFLLPVDDPGVLRDVDVPGDLRAHFSL